MGVGRLNEEEEGAGRNEVNVVSDEEGLHMVLHWEGVGGLESLAFIAEVDRRVVSLVDVSDVEGELPCLILDAAEELRGDRRL